MQKFCQPALVISVIFAFVLAACGREQVVQPKMTEEQAFEQLSDLPMEQTRGAFGKKLPSAQGLVELLQKLIAEGKIKVPMKGHTAINGMPDLSGLTNILSLITSGQATNVFSLVSALLGQTNSDGTKVKFDLSFIISIINAAMPVIATIAPQFAPILGALQVILPLVNTFISLFKKPTPSPTAMFMVPVSPVRA